MRANHAVLAARHAQVILFVENSIMKLPRLSAGVSRGAIAPLGRIGISVGTVPATSSSQSCFDYCQSLWQQCDTQCGGNSACRGCCQSKKQYCLSTCTWPGRLCN